MAKITFNCELCGKEITKQKNLKYKARFCSSSCRNKFAGTQSKPPMTQEWKSKISKSKSGVHIWGGSRKLTWFNSNNNVNWKGDNVGYRALHAWVERIKGSPMWCAVCQKGKTYQWANKSGEYKRDIDDYIELCTSCHSSIDRERRVGLFQP